MFKFFVQNVFHFANHFHLFYLKRIQNEDENRIENANSKEEENRSRKDNISEENLSRKNNIFKKLTSAEFRQPMARNNTFQKLAVTDLR
jgi:hypothetical protein